MLLAVLNVLALNGPAIFICSAVRVIVRSATANPPRVAPVEIVTVTGSAASRLERYRKVAPSLANLFPFDVSALAKATSVPALVIFVTVRFVKGISVAP